MYLDIVLHQYFLIYVLVSTLVSFIESFIISGIVSYCAKLRWFNAFLLSYLMALVGNVIWIYFLKFPIDSYAEAFDLWFVWHVLASAGVSLIMSLLYCSYVHSQRRIRSAPSKENKEKVIADKLVSKLVEMV